MKEKQNGLKAMERRVPDFRRFSCSPRPPVGGRQSGTTDNCPPPSVQASLHPQVPLHLYFVLPVKIQQYSDPYHEIKDEFPVLHQLVSVVLLLQQESQALDVIVASGKAQRYLNSFFFFSFERSPHLSLLGLCQGVGSSFDEQLHHVEMPRLGRVMHAGPAILIHHIDIRPLRDEQGHHLVVAVHGGQVERSAASPVFGVLLLGGTGEEHADDGYVALLSGQVQRDDVLKRQILSSLIFNARRAPSCPPGSSSPCHDCSSSSIISSLPGVPYPVHPSPDSP